MARSDTSGYVFFFFFFFFATRNPKQEHGFWPSSLLLVNTGSIGAPTSCLGFTGNSN